MPSFNRTIARAAEYLGQIAGAGATTAEIASRLGLHVNHVGGALGVMHNAGTIGWHLIGAGCAHNRRRWYAVEHRPEVAPIVVAPKHPPPIRRKRAQALATTARVIERDVQPTVCPSGRDDRFRVTLPAGYVSELDPSDCRTWARAVA